MAVNICILLQAACNLLKLNTNCSRTGKRQETEPLGIWLGLVNTIFEEFNNCFRGHSPAFKLKPKQLHCTYYWHKRINYE